MSDIAAQMGSWFSGMVKELQDTADKCAKEAVYEKLPEISDGLKEIYKEAVDRWYSAYTPKYYRRNHSLYDLMTIRVNDTDAFGASSLEYEFDDANMTKDRHGGSLFEKVFLKGWHGGAYGEGTIRYRFPPYAYFVWGRRAVRTAPAYFLFEKQKGEYEDIISVELSEAASRKFLEMFGAN